MAPQTSIPVNTSLYLQPAQFSQLCQWMHGSGVVDQLFFWDQITNFWPQHLWNVENSPMAAVFPDIDSYAEAFGMASYAAAAAPGAGIAVSTDAIRRGPAELTQMAWTLSNLSGAKVTIQIGAGEAKQTGPVGWKRSEGLARLEDHLRQSRAFWDAKEPVTQEGNHWNLNRAWLGSARPPRPEVWALGGGPKLLDLATSYADGFAAIAPCVFDTPERFADHIAVLKKDLERKGRDPEAFSYGLWFMNALHEDPAVIDKAFEGEILQWMAANFGRLDQADWARAGLPAIYPEGWHYSVKLRPMNVTPEESSAVLAKATSDHCRAAFSYGSPAEVANYVSQYVEAGCTHVAICDLLPLVLPPEDATGAMARSIEVCRLVKGAAG